MATNNLLHFPKQSKHTRRIKKRKQKCTVLQWIRNGYQIPDSPITVSRAALEDAVQSAIKQVIREGGVR